MSRTVTRDPERARLEHRAGRIERVIAELEDRAVYRRAVSGEAPAPLQRAIADFRIELGGIRRRLVELDGR